MLPTVFGSALKVEGARLTGLAPFCFTVSSLWPDQGGNRRLWRRPIRLPIDLALAILPIFDELIDDFRLGER